MAIRRKACAALRRCASRAPPANHGLQGVDTEIALPASCEPFCSQAVRAFCAILYRYHVDKGPDISALVSS